MNPFYIFNYMLGFVGGGISPTQNHLLYYEL
jgi:hypothetical protein